MKRFTKNLFIAAFLPLMAPFKAILHTTRGTAFTTALATALATALLTGCATKPSAPLGNNKLQAGFYILECDAFYESGLVHVSPIRSGWHVNALEGFAGSFDLILAGKKPNEVKMENANIDYRDLKRSLKGWAFVYPENRVEGEATVWMKRTRHHRSDRPFQMRPATEKEFERTKRHLIAREEWTFGDIDLNGSPVQN